MTEQVNVIKSRRKTISIQINQDLTITVRAPLRATNRDIERVLNEKEPWIRKHLEQMREKKELLESEDIQYLSYDEIKELADKALIFIPQRVEYYSKIIGVSYGRITIRNQKTRWGSCSQSGNLNFNCLLMMAPLEVVDYVVVHELCHRKQMNHSRAFWAEVESVLPNYKRLRKWLKDEGEIIMMRMRIKGFIIYNDD